MIEDIANNRLRICQKIRANSLESGRYILYAKSAQSDQLNNDLKPNDNQKLVGSLKFLNKTLQLADFAQFTLQKFPIYMGSKHYILGIILK